MPLGNPCRSAPVSVIQRNPLALIPLHARAAELKAKKNRPVKQKVKDATNKLKNIFLGIIAINLTLFTLFQLNIWPSTVNANELTSTVNYGLVPLNEDGSIAEGKMSKSNTSGKINISSKNKTFGSIDLISLERITTKDGELIYPKEFVFHHLRSVFPFPPL